MVYLLLSAGSLVFMAVYAFDFFFHKSGHMFVGLSWLMSTKWASIVEALLLGIWGVASVYFLSMAITDDGQVVGNAAEESMCLDSSMTTPKRTGRPFLENLAFSVTRPSACSPLYNYRQSQVSTPSASPSTSISALPSYASKPQTAINPYKRIVPVVSTSQVDSLLESSNYSPEVSIHEPVKETTFESLLSEEVMRPRGRDPKERFVEILQGTSDKKQEAPRPVPRMVFPTRRRRSSSPPGGGIPPAYAYLFSGHAENFINAMFPDEDMEALEPLLEHWMRNTIYIPVGNAIKELNIMLQQKHPGYKIGQTRVELISRLLEKNPELSETKLPFVLPYLQLCWCQENVIADFNHAQLNIFPRARFPGGSGKRRSDNALRFHTFAIYMDQAVSSLMNAGPKVFSETYIIPTGASLTSPKRELYAIAFQWNDPSEEVLNVFAFGEDGEPIKLPVTPYYCRNINHAIITFINHIKFFLDGCIIGGLSIDKVGLNLEMLLQDEV
ncbi:unnamed protein product, partial [Mesorhabditis spiculigera]